MVEADEVHTLRAAFGAPQEFMGYSAEQFLDSKVYKASTALHPEDVEVADEYLARAAEAEGKLVAARVRIITADGEPIPVLVFVRGCKRPGSDTIVAAGGVLDVSNSPALQGAFGVL